MTIINLQTFMSAFVRDASMRDQFSENKQLWYEKFQLTPPEKELADQIDFFILELTGKKMLIERRDKREYEYSEFCGILKQCGVFEEFFDGFARKYTQGMLFRQNESVRFLEYSKNYIAEHNLPTVMYELLEYSFMAGEMSYRQREHSKNIGEFTWDKPLVLKKPYAVRDFAYDITYLVANPNIRSFQDVEQTPHRAHKLCFQKSYTQALSSNIFEVSDPLFMDLVGRALAGEQIITHSTSADQRRTWQEWLSSLYAHHIIGFAE